MPELPEVEVTRRGLAGRIHGAAVIGVRIGKPLRWPLGIEPAQLLGRRVGAVGRRGKYLWLPLAQDDRPAETGDGASPATHATRPNLAAPASGGLLLHLGMSGSLAFIGAPELAGLPGAHDHFDLETDLGLLRLTDPRRFGAVVWSTALDAAPAVKLLGGLGIEPFDPAFDGAHLHAAFRRRRTAVKLALLAGDIVVGAGNIYASEALFGAGIDPRTRCDRVSRPRCDRLAEAVRETLQQALTLGGSTLRDFRDTHGVGGQFQRLARVYDRAGQPCLRCGAVVRRIVQGQRSTFFCPGCQRR